MYTYVAKRQKMTVIILEYHPFSGVIYDKPKQADSDFQLFSL